MNKELSKDKQMIKVSKIDWQKYIHIAVIIIGCIFILFPCFHTSIWFDESYSVKMATHTFVDIWKIGSYDVHPVLYYILLKIVGIFTNGSILAYRLFSALPLMILGVLGITHIRKDFGEKVGIIFSFLIFFMPITLVYSSEIRMYTWAMLFVTITAVYGYRIYKSGVSSKNWTIFSIFSLLSAYIHYYALVAVAIINIALFLYFLINNIKQRNYEVKYIKYSKNLKYSIISALIQVLLYLPWIGMFIMQVNQVSNGFWIGFPNFVEIFEFQFTGNLAKNIHITKKISYIFSLILAIYMIYLFSKNWKEAKPARIAMRFYFLVFLAVGLISLLVPILYARYFLNITGIFIFALAFLISKDNSKIRRAIICTMIIIVSTIVNINLITTNYDTSNNKPIEFVKSKIQEDDIIIIDNNGSGFVISAHFPNNKLYFLDRASWNVEEAYKAFGTTMYNLDILKDYKGRAWIISLDSDDFLNDIKNTLEGNIEVLANEKFDIKFQDYQFAISLIERN